MERSESEAAPSSGSPKGDNPNDVGADSVWKYEAGKVPWVTCKNDSGRVNCRLESASAMVRPTQVMFGKNPPVFFPEKATSAVPEVTLSEPFANTDQIVIAARPPQLFGDVQKRMPMPRSGASATYFMPYDVWRVTVTKTDSARVSLILNYDVTIRDAGFLVQQGAGTTRYFGSLGMPEGAAPENRTRSGFLPVTPGGTIGAYYEPSAIGGAPQLLIEKPGCYLATQGRPLLFDDGCKKTAKILADAELSGTVDAGSSGTVDAGSSGTVDAGSSGTVDAGSSGIVDAGSSGTPDAGLARCGTDNQPQCRDASGNWVCEEKFVVGRDQLCHACGQDNQPQCRDASGNWVCEEKFVEGRDQLCHACGQDNQPQCRDASGNWVCDPGFVHGRDDLCHAQ